MATARKDRRGSASGRQQGDGADGYGIDVPPSDRERQNELTAAVTIVAERRASIEQAKGMLMPIYGLDPQVAFELLKRRSQGTNMKLQLLARQVADFAPSAAEQNVHPDPPTTNCY
jgi:ANTAR domain